MRKNLLVVFVTLLTITDLVQAEKVVEIPISKNEWIKLESMMEGAYFSRPTDKGITILVEDDNLNKLKEMGFTYTILEDLTEEKKLYYTGKTQYHTFSQMATELAQLAQTYQNIAKLDTIGYSVQGRPMLCLKISDNPTQNDPEPKIRFVGAHHGNEWISAEVPFLYAKYLLENYSSNPSVKSLVNSREIYIIPIVNPDGHESQNRTNSNSVDLNRNYGYIKNGSGSVPYSEPETRSIHEFSKNRNFNMSLSFHSGAQYVNYIWNYTPVRSADDRYNNMIYQYSVQYGNITGYSVTEGYDWYQTLGDLNDYSYGINGDIDWTIEVSNNYIPDPSQIDIIFNANRPAMDLFAQKAGQGIAGFVIDSITQDTVKTARITLYPLDWPIWTDRYTGDFIRPLLPGNYSIKVEAPGYTAKTISNINVQQDNLTWITVLLAPREDKRVNLFKPELIYINSQQITVDTFETHYALGDRDSLYYSLGISGYAIFDLGTEVKGDSIYVYEGVDAVPSEGFELFVSNYPYGPWSQVGGRAYGNALIPCNSNFRYIKIVDDGDGSSSSRKCGYDLDAIVVKVKPDLELLTYEVHEGSGNGNGFINPGELGTLCFSIQNNSSFTISQVSILPICIDPYIQFLEDSTTLFNLTPGCIATDSFTFLTESNLPYDYEVSINLELHVEPYIYTLPLTFVLNQKDSTVYAGPDDYGYFAYDSVDSLYNEFENLSLRDISSIGTIITQITNSDDATTQLDLPFTFKYYGINYNNISVCSNGWIAMGITNINTCVNRPIPDPSNPPALIAPLFMDLDPSASGDIYYYYDLSAHEFILMWKNVKVWGSASDATFEIVLRDPSYYSTLTGDGEIIFIFGDMPQHINATTGIESPSHSTGLLLYYNGNYDPSISLLRAGQFIKLTTDPPVVTPVPEWFQPIVKLGSTIAKNMLLLEIANIPFGKISVFDVTGRLIMQDEFIASHGRVNLSLHQIKRGVYFIKISSTSRNFEKTFKFVKID